MGRSSRASSGLVLIAFALASASASAHRRDELLQAARIGIEQQHVQLELSLTPGIALADAISGEIDRDRDGVLSDDERGAFANEVLSALQLAVDGRPTRIAIVTSSFPTIEALRGGDAPIELRATAALPPLRPGQHQVSFSNAYRRDIAVYLVNALVPDDDRIAITSQQRDPEQRTTTIKYVIASRSSAVLPLVLVAPAAIAWLFHRRRLLPYGTRRS